MFSQSVLHATAALCAFVVLGVDGHKTLGERVRTRHQRAVEYIEKPQRIEARQEPFRYLSNETSRACCYTSLLAALLADT